MRTPFAWVLILIASLAHGASRDDDFLAAREAYRAGDGNKLALLAKRLTVTSSALRRLLAAADQALGGRSR